MPPQNGNLEPLYYINVGKEGTFHPSGHYRSTSADVDNIIEELKIRNTKTLVIYLHGGLVSERSGMNSAERMKEKFYDAAAKRHVVSFVWETGPVEVLKQMDDESKSELFKIILKKVIKLAAKNLDVPLGDRGAGSYLTDQEIEAELAKPLPFKNEERDLESRGGFDVERMDDYDLQSQLEREAGFVFTMDDKKAIDELDQAKLVRLDDKYLAEFDDRSRGIAFLGLIKAVGLIAFRVIKRYIQKTHHDFYPTVIEELFRELYLAKIGEFGWSQIKRKAEGMFSDNNGRAGTDLFAGEYFFQKLMPYYKERADAGNPMNIELIGHSAGAIAICYLLDAIRTRHQHIRINNIFFLAPACRTELFQSHVIPALGNAYNTFRIFTMREDKEKDDHCVPVLYTRSLLYMISGLFEDEVDAKILGLYEQSSARGRYAVEPLLTISQFLQQRVVLSDIIHADVRLSSTALKHGDFDNDDYTLEAIRATI